MSKLEMGESYPGLEIIGKLAGVLGVEPAELPRLPAKKGSVGNEKGPATLIKPCGVARKDGKISWGAFRGRGKQIR
ncbi:MAG TPA: helix-turn-helix transcriptional regulator [Xanthobacteraceae bacterium]|jgi:hypothetical protein